MISAHVQSDPATSGSFRHVALCFVLCAGDVDSRRAQSSGETAGTRSDPDLSGQTESSKSPSVRHQQAAAQIQPGQLTGNQVETYTHTKRICYKVGSLTHIIFILD